VRITESQLRRVVRQEILREWTIEQALAYSPETTLDSIIALIKEIFGPTHEEKLKRAGDDKVLDKLITELAMLHTTPEYRIAWENYKTLQRQHRSMDTSPAIEKALARIKERMFRAMDTAEASISRQNRDAVMPGMTSARRHTEKLWRGFEEGKLTAGGLLRMLDPAGISESRRR